MRKYCRLSQEHHINRWRSNKNTNRWCKGIPGREHVLVWKEDPKYRSWRRHLGMPENVVYSIEVCEGCGQESGNTAHPRMLFNVYDGRTKIEWTTHGPAF